MSDLIIRPLHGEDKARECTAQLAEFGPWRTHGVPAARLFKDLTNPQREMFIAELAGKIVGVLVLHLGGSFDGYIQLLAIFPEFQNRGFGEQILKFAEAKIFQHTKNVFLSVSSFNVRAQKFYERLGYERVGELPNFLTTGFSEILMRKTTGPLLDLMPPK